MNTEFRTKLLMAIKIWVAIYPAITLVLWLFGRQLGQLPLAFRTLVLTLILVPLMVFVLLPLVHKLFNLVLGLRKADRKAG